MNKKQMIAVLDDLLNASDLLIDFNNSKELNFYLPPEDINKLKIAGLTVLAVHKKLKNNGKVKYLLRRG